MGKTQAVTFPAKFEITEAGITMTGEVELDRTKFGMDKMTDKVEKVVALSLAIGIPSELSE